ncbi:MAG: NAD(P)-binding domain-containing protein [Paludibacter sp.]|nr:NAD(P)-binding domain-containing protein [Bacteroidales bacterium]MCM1069007.1 NAD(P)-binding domain-containing protein [Prevotella sp.]MCM1353670.1 NAD(P)-binding domain-containing protein [Bacteroides sp.]MCM1441981.1 NAD(P)-binding domain-containing protein [Muribaculum sp.]MCM1481563.1 NAD(P)-binding domain-containing protein [Paludibacter sp.]
MNILFTTHLPQSAFVSLSEHALTIPQMPYFTEEELRTHIADADILVATFDYKISADMLRCAPRLQLIANFGVGYNNIDISYAKAHGIRVTNTPDPVIEPTAEHAFALMHAIAHRIAELDRLLRIPQSPIRFGVMNNLGVSLYGKTLGIIGMGNIGQALARRAVAAGMNIIYHNRHRLPADKETPYQAQYVDFETILTQADFLSLNLPYTPDVHHLIGKEQLQRMKPSALLINTARGAHVDEAALADALQQQIIAGAALDVYENEPHINNTLKTLDNVVLSPHIGTGTIDGRLDMCRCVTDNINAFIHKEYHKMNSVI